MSSEDENRVPVMSKSPELVNLQSKRKHSSRKINWGEGVDDPPNEEEANS